MNDATTSLLTEHFSYTPLSLIDDIINSINNLVYQAISSLESGLLSTPPERLGFGHATTNGSTIPDTDEEGNVVYPEAKLEIENGLHLLETLLEANVDKAFDKFEIYVLRNIFTVPEDLLGWLRLKHYENLQFDVTADAPTPESIQAQRKKLHETRKLNRSLKLEVARNDAIIRQLQSILSATKTEPAVNVERDEEKVAVNNNNQDMERPDLDLSFLTSGLAAQHLRVGAVSGPQTKHTPLTTNTTFILSQLPGLQTMLKQLRPKLATLSQPVDPAVIETTKDERKEYIDSRIRLHLERAGQLSVSGDGHPLVGGRRIGPSETEALETVTAMLTTNAKAQ